MKHLPRTIALCMICGVTIWICVWLWWPVIFVPCLSALLASFFIEPVFAPYMPEQEETEKTEEMEESAKLKEDMPDESETKK